MDKLKHEINYWYMRYLLVTELYMVEKWERHLFHVLLTVILIILGITNYLVLVGSVKYFRLLYFHYTVDLPNDNIPRNLSLSSAEL